MRTRPGATAVASSGVLTILILVGLVAGGPTVALDGPSADAAAAESAEAETEVVLYYFHGNRRCNTCRSIESYARQAIEGKFEDALESGRLGWKVLNTDESENAHFVKDFGLFSSSLVLVEVRDEEAVRHEVLQEAWTLVRDKGRFIQYIQGSVAEFLE